MPLAFRQEDDLVEDVFIPVAGEHCPGIEINAKSKVRN